MGILSDDLDSVAAEIQQGFMQRGGFTACRYLLGKLVEEMEEKDQEDERQLVQIARFIGRDASSTEGVNSIAEVVEEEINKLRAKLSHRKCWDCGHVDYYTSDVLRYCRCSNCQSRDTRLVHENVT